MYQVQLQQGEETDMLFIYASLAISQYMFSHWFSYLLRHDYIVLEGASSCFLSFMPHAYAMCQCKIGENYGNFYIGVIHRIGLGSYRIVSFAHASALSWTVA